MTDTPRPKRKRRVMRSLTIKEISGVDSAAQVPAEALLMKRAESQPRGESMTNYLTKIEDAERVVTKGAQPTFTREQYHEAMAGLAKREARPGEGVCNAFARLLEDDPRMVKLYDAGEAAECIEEQRSEALAKRATRNERVWELMVKGAHTNRRSGETVEQTMERLLLTDETYKDAYALYCE